MTDRGLIGTGALAALALWVLLDPGAVIWFGVVYAAGLAVAVLLAGARRRPVAVHGVTVVVGTVLLSLLELRPL